MPTMTQESPLARLRPEQIEAIGRELDAIHDEVFADLGDRDRRYITSMVEMHRRLVVLGRILLLASHRKPAWIAGTSLLSLVRAEHASSPRQTGTIIAGVRGARGT
jgi:linoleoyl-CoA desaturase